VTLCFLSVLCAASALKLLARLFQKNQFQKDPGKRWLRPSRKQPAKTRALAPKPELILLGAESLRYRVLVFLCILCGEAFRVPFGKHRQLQ
jgi:hypothetical protein